MALYDLQHSVYFVIFQTHDSWVGLTVHSHYHVAFFASYILGPEKSINRRFFTFSQAPFMVLCSCLAQGSSLEPKSISSKIIFLLSFFLGVMVLASLNATLTSHLAVFKLSLPFTDLGGILATDFTFKVFNIIIT